jgi:hypothetical protein
MFIVSCSVKDHIINVDQDIIDVSEHGLHSVFENWLDNPEVKSPRPLPLPRIVKAVSGYDSSYSCICQNPEVRSNIKKMVEFALPMLPMHSGISFILHLSM